MTRLSELEVEDLSFRYSETYINHPDGGVANIISIYNDGEGHTRIDLSHSENEWETDTVDYTEDLFSDIIFPESKFINLPRTLYKANRVCAQRGYKKAMCYTNIQLIAMCNEEADKLTDFNMYYNHGRNLDRRTAKEIYNPQYPSIDDAVKQIMDKECLGRALSPMYGIKISVQYNTLILLHFIAGVVGYLTTEGVVLFSYSKYLEDELRESNILSSDWRLV